MIRTGTTTLILSATALGLMAPLYLSAQNSEDADASETVPQETSRTVSDATELQEMEADGQRREEQAYDDELNELWEQQPSELQQNIEELARSFEDYRSAVENGEFQEADTLAKRIVELSIKINGLDSHESAKALTNLALVQSRNREFESSQLNFSAAISIIERIEDRLHKGLINPLKGLGTSQLHSGRPDMALQTFARAKHVSHVNEGPHNKEQIDVLNSVAETFMTMGDVEEAMDVQQSIYNIESRNIDVKSMDIIPALERQAHWLHRLGLYHKERNNWRKIVRIIEDHYGNDDLGLIPPLTSLGKSYLFVGSMVLEYESESPMVSGEIYLKRAMRIAEKHPDSSWQLAESTKLALADYYILSSRPNRAERYYEETWELLSEEEDRADNLRNHLQSLVVLQSIHPPKYYNSQRVENGEPVPENFERGRVVAQYAITQRGETSNTKIIESLPPIESMESAVLRELRYFMRRPRMENGTTVRTDELVYTHEFFYRLSDVEPIGETEVALDLTPE